MPSPLSLIVDGDTTPIGDIIAFGSNFACSGRRVMIQPFDISFVSHHMAHYSYLLYQFQMRCSMTMHTQKLFQISLCPSLIYYLSTCNFCFVEDMTMNWQGQPLKKNYVLHGFERERFEIFFSIEISAPSTISPQAI
jgi:hypothetical protein